MALKLHHVPVCVLAQCGRVSPCLCLCLQPRRYFPWLCFRVGPSQRSLHRQSLPSERMNTGNGPCTGARSTSRAWQCTLARSHQLDACTDPCSLLIIYALVSYPGPCCKGCRRARHVGAAARHPLPNKEVRKHICVCLLADPEQAWSKDQKSDSYPFGQSVIFQIPGRGQGSHMLTCFVRWLFQVVPRFIVGAYSVRSCTAKHCASWMIVSRLHCVCDIAISRCCVQHALAPIFVFLCLRL